MLNKIVPLIAYAASVWISRKYAAGYWVVGSVFALAALTVNYPTLKKFSLKHLLFIGASVLTYALVYWISRGWELKPEWLDMIAGSLSAAVVTGSILMPSIHAMLFGTDYKTVRETSLLMITAWYGMLLLSGIDDKIGLTVPIDYLLLTIALWQGFYLKWLKLP